LHGPYWSWTRKVDNKTQTRYLSDDEVDDYQAFFDNAKRLRSLLVELEALSLSVVERGGDPNKPSNRSRTR
jgi:hypothetical protein